jgi:phosphatidate cytidylyltransferase
LKQRIITGVVAGAVFVTMLALGGYWFFALVLLLAIVGFDEFVRMVDLKKYALTRLMGFVALLGLTVPWEAERLGIELSIPAIIWLFMFVLFSITVLSKNKFTIDQAALLFIGVLYLGFGFHYMAYTRWLEPHGLYWALLVFFCIWAGDSGAYFSGKLFGKTPLWPSISPNKTVEGAIGGILLSVAVAVIFAVVSPELLEYWRAVAIGVVIALVGMMGDLIQSAYKRVKGIKDTGSILPGHGGVLDRVDSWLIVFPFLHMLSMIP